MSHPVSSLKKTQRPPLYSPAFGQRQLPFRNPVYTEDESKLLEEVTGGMATQRMKQRDPFAGGIPKLLDNPSRASHGATPRTGDVSRSNTDLVSVECEHSNQLSADHELMSTMISRITQLESKLAYQTKELTEMSREKSILQEKLKLLQKSQEQDGDTHVSELENKCYLLQQQVYDMESFLADYGLVWVGKKLDSPGDVYHDDDDDSEEEEVWRPETSVSQEPAFHVDYDLLVKNVQDLNTLAGEGVAIITNTKGGARLKMPDAVQLTLYANGIILFSGPFRPFTDQTTRTCVQDMMDGYFPSELQHRYPDGVPFAITDRREVHFEDKRERIFQGAGQTLGGDTMPSRLVPSKLQDSTADKTTDTGEPDNPARETTSELPGPQLTVQQFLDKLPKSVVKGGKIIDIRTSVGDTFQFQGASDPQAGSVTLVETNTVVDWKKRLEEQKEGSRPYTPRHITTLRVKSEMGDRTYILKMKFLETVGDLRKYLQLQRPPGSPQFEIASTYPNKVHTDDSITLHDAGLTPNAVLHLKLKKT